MSIETTMIIGIVTGILTTAILYILKVLWTSKIVPLIVKLRYQGVQINGNWYGGGENDDENNGAIFKASYYLDLEQSAHDLKGTFIFKYKAETKDFEINFLVNGYIWEGYVTLNFTPKDKRLTSYATTMFKLHAGGTSLDGIFVFRHVDDEKVIDMPMTLYRDIDQKSGL